MDKVGTAVGNVYKSREGFGKSAILPRSNSVDVFATLKPKNVNDKKDSIKKLYDFDPEYWYRHDEQKKLAINEIFNMGSELSQAGIDPWTGTDVGSQAFQKKVQNAKSMGTYSKQLKDLHKAYQAKLQANGDKYTDDSKYAVASFFETPLTELVGNNIQPPELILRQPDFNLLAYDTGLLTEISKGDKQEFTDLDVGNFAARSLEDGNVSEAIRSQILSLSPEQKKLLKRLSENEGLTPQMYLRTNQLRPLFLSETDKFDFDAFEKSIIIGQESTSYENEKGVTTGAVKTSKSRIKDVVTLKMTPQYVRAGVKAGKFGNPQNSLKENKEEAINYLTDLKDTSAPRKSFVRRDGSYNNFLGGGSTKEVVDNNFMEWLKDIRSGVVEAGAYLTNVKLPDGSRLESVERMPEFDEEQSDFSPLFMTTKVNGWHKITVDAEGNEVKKWEEKRINEPLNFLEATDEELRDYYLQSYKNKKALYGVSLVDEYDQSSGVRPSKVKPQTGGSAFIPE